MYHENNIDYPFETSCKFDHGDRDVSYFVINREFSKAWPYYFYTTGQSCLVPVSSASGNNDFVVNVLALSYKVTTLTAKLRVHPFQTNDYNFHLKSSS